MKKVYKKGVFRVRRGGSWYYNASGLRVANRDYNSPSSQYNYIGARSAKRVKYEKSV
jgi:formylglycine-generating enzyme required for sulfatase activity